ncbi:hypothetical protein EIP91_008018 [Steccherinum ochraceum]|uniref:BTB domain-containing protein n=1 Tax=Steccherinum ochraceum TaxID=92696 RepID=A0A4R0RBL7_9APHY|nr:hypothetical protein EIP91_008018 [Steccherinum ochraceum]
MATPTASDNSTSEPEIEKDKPTEDGKETLPRDASPPFNKPSANVIIRTADSVDFRVQQAILAEASTVFADMFSLPATGPGQKRQQREDDDQEYRDGIPVISVTESSKTMDILLRYCYPLVRPPLPTPSDFCNALVAARKYMVEHMETELKGLYPGYASQSPLSYYALASAQSGWVKEMKIAAKAALRVPFLFGYVAPEMRHMNASAYVWLQLYHGNCAAAAASAILSRGPSSHPLLPLQTLDNLDYVFFSCNHDDRFEDRVVNLVHVKRLNKIVEVESWFMEYLNALASLVLQAPLASIMGLPEIYSRKGALTMCTDCSRKVHDDVGRFTELLMEAVRKAVDGVPLQLHD